MLKLLKEHDRFDVNSIFKISKLKHQLSQAEERSNKFERDSKNVEVFQKKVSLLNSLSLDFNIK